MSRYWYVIVMLFCCFACDQGKQPSRFSIVPAAHSAVTFQNTIQETEQLNVMNFEYMYNGGGVAVGDLNGDSLPDLYFTGNMVPDKLYLNQGGLSFRDVTDAAGITNHNGWKTGVTMADVNADGLLDIYVCYSGNTPVEERHNQLFINQGIQQGVPVFKDMAAAYGLDGKGSNATQAAFFDYDRDGDLDMFLLDHATMFYNPFYNTTKLRTLRHPYFGNKLYRNDSLHFTDVSEAAGIKGGGINFGLGIAISDVNNDGWPDIYVTNDYEEQDFLYLNNHDGTFNGEAIKQAISHISKNGMGVDIADYNNDGLQDIVVLDMLPEDNYRQKMLRGPDDYDRYHLLVENGYYHQNMRNTLQLNNGITPAGIPVYSEIGQLAGVSNTDWSWAPLLADYDNDGLKDLFITNGVLHDFTDMDFLKYKVADARRQQGNNMQLAELVKQMPSLKTSNYMFRNNGDLTFADVTKDWGLHVPSVNNGAVYADLDNDGDLDLAVNGMNEPSTIWENHSNASQPQHYITIALKGKQPNTFAIGAKVSVKAGATLQCQELYPARGFQSTVDHRLHFGLGKDSLIDQLLVQWPNGHTSTFHHVKPDRIFTIDETQTRSDTAAIPAPAASPLFEDVTSVSGLNYTQKENQVVDFKYQPLLPYQLSCQGPQLSKGDVNGDGLEDVFIGGPQREASALFLQTVAGTFVKGPSQPWMKDSLCETTGSVFFDADNDGDLDLYAVSGGNEVYTSLLQLQDRLYINNGKGDFEKAENILPSFSDSRSCVVAADYDKDGDADLFIGGRLQPMSFPLPSRSYVLRNDGQLKFTDVTEQVAPALRNAGMVTSAVWTDVNKDSWPDLMVVGEWMPVKLFINKQGQLSDASDAAGLSASGGLWQKIVADDVDSDGDTDFIIGNLAPNTQFKASVQQPMSMYVKDFDGDGVVDPIICYYIQGKSYPYPSRDELLEQMVMLRKRYVHYSDYANTTIGDLFPPDALQKSKVYYVQQLHNIILVNEGGARFSVRELPVQAQFSALFGILPGDYDNDGKKDLLLSGNFYPFRVQLGREDASKGLLLKGNGKGSFSPLGYQSTGLLIEGDVRDMISVTNARKEKLIIVAKSNGSVQVTKGK